MNTTLSGYQIVFVDPPPSKKPKPKEPFSWVLKLPAEEFPTKDSLKSREFFQLSHNSQNAQAEFFMELRSLSPKSLNTCLPEAGILSKLADMALEEALLPEAELVEEELDEEVEVKAEAKAVRKAPFFRFNSNLKPKAQRVAPEFVSNAREYSGSLLGEVRCFHGMSLGELADATRVAQHHLHNIEREQYDSLPAMVYLRGYLKSVARELGLDMQRVSQSYLDRMQQSKS